jgi:hypothetical protein
MQAVFRSIAMEKTNTTAFPRWLFAVLAIGGLLAAGIFIGVMSVAGLTGSRIIQAAGFTIFGLLMFWGALAR